MANRYNLKTPRKKRGITGNRPRSNRARSDSNSALPYWIAGIIVLLLVGVIVTMQMMPHIHGWITAMNSAPKPASATAKPSAVAPSDQADEMLKDLQLKLAAQEKKQIAERAKNHAAAEAKAKALAAQKAAQASVIASQQAAQSSKENPALTGAPAVQPPKPIAPARALPVDPNVLTTERIAAYQVALERMHFSCGFIDGDQGMRTQRMLRAFQQSRDLPQSGVLDDATRAAIGEPGEPFLSYTVTQADVESIMPKPQTWRDKAKATRLGYNDIWEMLAEKFHCTRGYLKDLNRDVKQPVAGSDIIGPKVYPAAAYPLAASLRVNLGETSIEALDASGRVIAFFPCSIAKDKNKRPNGRLVVKSVVPDPDYTFDPALFKDASVAEHITHKMTLPPGPRNPVGTAWIGLSLPGYGIHGTPEPENISRTQSHGCFRLANWNANKVLKMVRVGTPVDVEP
jgi:lipoprotein-anchoring transpeptidase ErfK/SrfK